MSVTLLTFRFSALEAANELRAQSSVGFREREREREWIYSPVFVQVVRTCRCILCITECLERVFGIHIQCDLHK